MAGSVQELYGEIWGREDPELAARLRRSLSPRSPDLLFDRFGELGVGPDALVLDVGGRDARYAAELARRFGCRVMSIDPVALHLEHAASRVAEAGLRDRVVVRQGQIEALPVDDAVADAIWCRDVLPHVDLPAGLAECFRALKPGAPMLIYNTFATDRLEAEEARRIYAALAIVPESMASARFEATARAVGFEIAARDVVDSEWREYWIERGEWNPAEDLLLMARMRRSEAELVRDLGRARYEAEYAGILWGIYQLLGKLCPTIYLLRKPNA